MVRAVIPQYRSTLAGQVNPLPLSRSCQHIPVEPRGFEPRTSAVQGRRSPRLSYGPIRFRRSPPLWVGAPGLEPGTSALSGPRSNHLSYAPILAGMFRSCVNARTHRFPMCRRRSKTQLHCDIHISTPGSTYHERPCQADHDHVTTTSPEPVPRKYASLPNARPSG